VEGRAGLPAGSDWRKTWGAAYIPDMRTAVREYAKAKRSEGAPKCIGVAPDFPFLRNGVEQHGQRRLVVESPGVRAMTRPACIFSGDRKFGEHQYAQGKDCGAWR
jgi:hypothetical protein